MGYTHYWTQARDFSQDEWKEITAQAKDVLEIHGRVVCYEQDKPNRRPQVDSKMIRFNGKEDDGHETFVLTCKMGRVRPGETEAFSFCKTNYKPYDVAVVEVLKVAKKVAPDALRLASDGGPEVFGEDYYGEEN